MIGRMYISLVFLIVFVEETSGSTFCRNIGDSRNIQVATFCQSSQASGNTVIVDGYEAYEANTSRSCLCKTVLTIPETSTTNFSKVAVSAYFNLQPNYDECGSAVTLNHADTNIRMACKITGSVIANNNDTLQLRLVKENDPEDTRYCLNVHVQQNPSATVSITCYEGNTESPSATTTQASKTTSSTTTLTSAAPFSSSSSTIEDSSIYVSSSSPFSFPSSSSITEQDQTNNEISTNNDLIFSTQPSISTKYEDKMTTFKASNNVSTQFNSKMSYSSSVSSTTLQPDGEDDIGDDPAFSSVADDVNVTFSPTLSETITPENATTMFPTTTNSDQVSSTTTEMTTESTEPQKTSTITTTTKLTSTDTETTNKPEITWQYVTTSEPSKVMTTFSSKTERGKTTTEKFISTLPIQEQTTTTMGPSTGHHMTTPTTVKPSISSVPTPLPSPTSSKKPPDAEASEDLPIEVIIPVACVGGIILICVVICIAFGIRRNGCGCNDDTQPLSNTLVDRVSVDIKNREIGTYVNPLFDDISLTGKSDHSDVESMMQEIPSDDEDFKLPDTTKIDGELWTHL